MGEFTPRDAERKVEDLRRERDQLGGVNMNAEEEAAELEERLGSQVNEKEDLTAAIAKLREGVDALNAEGRERLLVAFETVNEHFKALFTGNLRSTSREKAWYAEPDVRRRAGFDRCRAHLCCVPVPSGTNMRIGRSRRAVG